MIVCFSRIGPLGEIVRVEVDLRNALPGTDLVGLAGSEVRESRERVRAAIRNSGFEYPRQRVLINLAPAAVAKRGAGFDLAIAVAILSATGQLRVPEPLLVFGELSLDGSVSPVASILSAIVAARENGIETFLLPAGSEASVAGVCRSALLVGHLRDLKTHPMRPDPIRGIHPSEYTVSEPDFDDMIGQPLLKRAMMIAAAGGHNILLSGPPGSGKTMAARRLAALRPDLSSEEALSVARAFSIRGIQRKGNCLSPRPPLRMPHHGASMEGLLGGGKDMSPGELTLANNGIFVLDEAAEFQPRVLQSLREPIETHRLQMVRAGAHVSFAADFQLVVTSNLCPCGKLGIPGSRCMCGIAEIERYWRRIGAAILDRIEIRIRTEYRSDREPAQSQLLTHGQMAERVRDARELQKHRFQRESFKVNARIPEGVSVGLFDHPWQNRLLDRIVARKNLSERGAHAIRTVARTIADIAGNEVISEEDILEAGAFRTTGTPSFLGRAADSNVYYTNTCRDKT